MSIKNILHICIALFLLPFIGVCQFGPPQQIFDTGGNESYLFDIDGDGVLDVLHITNDFVYWFKNMDGEGSFGNAQIIYNDLNQENVNRALYAGDIDGDNDLDVVYGSAGFNDQLAWFENTNGLGDFGPPQIIEENRTFSSTILEDIDGDNDLDLAYSSSGFDRIVMFKNTTGLGDFSDEVIVSNNADLAITVAASDIDNDNDLDLLSASEFDNKIAWYENTDGQGTFSSEKIITTDAIEARSVITSDIDGDGDMDVIAGARMGNNITWYENTNGQGNFGPQQVISINANRAGKVDTADIDRDGDMDVLSASTFNEMGSSELKMAWYENLDGLGTFGPQQVIAIDIGGIFMDVGDIDGDGDMDLLSTGGGGVVWFENLTPLGVNENKTLNTTLYPNPVEDLLTIASNTPINNIHCYDLLGKKTPVSIENNTLDVSHLATGIYILSIETTLGISFEKFSKL